MYQFVVEGEVAKFVIIHEDSVQQLKIALLETKKVNKTVHVQYIHVHVYCLVL